MLLSAHLALNWFIEPIYLLVITMEELLHMSRSSKRVRKDRRCLKQHPGAIVRGRKA